jgi:hypothetical protein
MEVELLVVPECPNETAGTALIRGVLDEMGLSDTPLAVRVVGSAWEAERLGFVGSPTVLVDGADAFPEPGRPPGLACRVYRTSTGLAGLPDASALRAALEAARDPAAASSEAPSA